MESLQPTLIKDCSSECSKSKEVLLLDTKGSCFLCLKDISTSDNYTTNGGHGDVGITPHCLRDICRYLKMNPGADVLDTLKGLRLETEDENDDKKVEKKNCNFSVILCPNCSANVGKLTQLIQELEMTKMRLKYELEIFHRVLTESGEDKEGNWSRWRDVENKMVTAGSNPVEVEIVEKMRHLANEKGSYRIKQLQETVLPKVLLLKLKSDCLTKMNKISPESLMGPHGIVLDSGRSRYSEQRITMDNCLTEDTDARVTITGSTESSSNVSTYPLGIIPDSRGPHSSEQLITLDKCSTGGTGTTVTNSGSTGSSSEVSMDHLGIIHDSREPHSSEQLITMDNYCSAGAADMTIAISRPTEASSTKIRLVDICSKYREIITTETDKISKCSLCDYRQVYASTRMSFQTQFYQHMLAKHPDKIFAEKKSPLDSDMTFLIKCKRVLHLATKRCRVEELGGQLFATSNANSSPYICVWCNQHFSNGTNFRYHFVLKHYRICLEMLTDRQDDQKIIDRRNRKRSLRLEDAQETFPQKKYPKTHTTSSCQQTINEKTTWTCDFGCGRQFSSGDNMRSHKRDYCPLRTRREIFECKLEEGGCGKILQARKSLRAHKRYHCPLKTNKKFWVCNPEDGGCGQKCSTPNVLAIHQRYRCSAIKSRNDWPSVANLLYDLTTTDDIEDADPCTDENIHDEMISSHGDDNNPNIIGGVGSICDSIGDVGSFIAPEVVIDESFETKVVVVEEENLDMTEGAEGIFPDY